MPETLSRRLTAHDAAFLYLERPNAPLHIGSLGVYQGQIPFERFVEHIESRLPLIPRYRQRLAPVPFHLAHPTWEDDPEFDIRNHIFRIDLPPPGTDEQLREVTTRLFTPPLDRSKPLWEMYVIHGIEGDRSAIASKVHHAMVDGVSGIQLLLAVVDITPEPAPPPEAEPWSPEPLPDPGARLIDGFWDNLLDQRRIWQDVNQSIRDPRRPLKQAQNMGRSLRTLSPWLLQPAPRMPFRTLALSSQRKLAFCEASFVEIREVRTALGGTVNDVVLAILAGAMRRYLMLHNYDVSSGEPRVAIPVNIRLEDEKGALGNRISGMLAALPIGEADPARRLDLVKERVGKLKEENQSGAIELVTRANTLIPVPFQALASPFITNTLVNLICTNVPGPMIPLYCVGHVLLEHYPLVPLSLDMGFGVGVTSYNQKLFFGLMADPEAMPDIDAMKAFVDESFLELRNAAGVAPTDIPAFTTNGASQKAEAPVVVAEQPV